MNKFFISLNVVLVIAVAILYYKAYHKNTPVVIPGQTGEQVNTSPAEFKVGYFELDSLDNNYKYQQDAKSQMIAREQSVEKQINDLQNEIREKYQEAQKKGPTMSQEEQTRLGDEINQLTAQNQNKAQRLQQSLNIESQTKMQQVRQTIQNYLKTFAKQQGYNYIIGTSEDDKVFYKDSAQDITATLLQNLNQLYTDSLKNRKK